MPGSILSLSEDNKDQPIEAVARQVEWGGEHAWQLEIRSVDGTILTQDPIDALSGFYDSAINYIGPLLNQAGLTYSGSSWLSNEDETEWTVPLQRIAKWFQT